MTAPEKIREAILKKLERALLKEHVLPEEVRIVIDYPTCMLTLKIPGEEIDKIKEERRTNP